MNQKINTVILTAFVFAVLALFSIPAAFAHGNGAKPDRGDGIDSTLVRGGLLYDNWPKVLGTKTEGNHPLYPANAKKSGSSTWRCKECHGWDYIGPDGRYSKGSHYTGIKGIAGAATLAEAKLIEVLNGAIPSHSFSTYMNDEDIAALATFIKEGQVDWAGGIDLTPEAGDIAAGKGYYTSQCSYCHGDDGNEHDLNGKKDGVQGVGWIANDNPQETLHKIRWGHPGSDMLSAVVDGKLDTEATINILRYSMTLK